MVLLIPDGIRALKEQRRKEKERQEQVRGTMQRRSKASGGKVTTRAWHKVVVKRVKNAALRAFNRATRMAWNKAAEKSANV